jgi:hypothetical protein
MGNSKQIGGILPKCLMEPDYARIYGGTPINILANVFYCKFFLDKNISVIKEKIIIVNNYSAIGVST